MCIILKNDTGLRRGIEIRYEYGEDLFGYFYLEIFRSRKHCSWRVKYYLFDNPRDFICTLDDDLEHRESLHYLYRSSQSTEPAGG